MAFYDNLAKTALRLIASKGRSITILYKTPGVYSAQADKILGATSPVPVDTKAAIVNYDDRLIDGALIITGDRKAVIAAKGLEKPQSGDIISDGGVEYSVVRTAEIGPGDTPIIYNVQIRK